MDIAQLDRQITHKNHELALVRESYQEAAAVALRAPGNTEAAAQVDQLRADVTRRENQLNDMAAARVALARQDARQVRERDDFKRLTAVATIESVMVDAQKLATKWDAAVKQLTVLAPAMMELSHRGTRAAHAAGLDPRSAENLLDMRPLGVALADALSRGDLVPKLPFCELIVHPRFDMPAAEQVAARNAKLQAMLDRAANGAAK